MKNKLIVKTIESSLGDAKPEYEIMLSNIDKTMPDIEAASTNFHKSHSQFMNVTVDVTAITPIRSIKHTLAEIDKTKTALQDAHIRMQKVSVKLKKKLRKLKKCTDDLNREMLEIEIFLICVVSF